MAQAGQTIMSSILQPAQMETQRITQAQSFEYAQVTLHSSIAVVLHDMSHLPLKAFQYVLVPCDRRSDIVYSEFVKGGGKEGYPVLQMKRSMSKRVDHLLDVIGGIFLAIKHRFLSTLQLVACHDPNEPSNAVECFTWSFQYTDDGQGYVTNMIANGPDNLKRLQTILINGKPISHDVNFSVGREVAFQIESFAFRSTPKGTANDFPEFPPHQERLSYFFHMHYNDNCPQNYEPYGFGGKPPASLKFHASDHHGRYDFGNANVNLGPIRIGMTSSMVDHIGRQSWLELGSKKISVPNQNYIDELKKEDAEKLAFEQVEKSLGFRVIRIPDPSPSEPSRRLTIANRPDSNLPAMTSQTIEDTNASTALQSYARSDASRQPSDLIPTQSYRIVGTSSAQNFSSSLGQLPPTYAPGEDFTYVFRGSKMPRLLIGKLRDLLVDGGQRKRISAGPLAKTSAEGKANRTIRGSLIRYDGRIPSPMNLFYGPRQMLTGRQSVRVDCLDGDQPSVHMIRCNICLTWQHLDCLGFTDFQDTRIPDIYVCYRCLFKDDDLALKKLENITFQRRVLREIQRNGYPKGPLSEVQKAFGCGPTDAQAITQSFKKAGYLKATPGSKVKGFSQKNEPSFQPQLYDFNEAENDVFKPMSHLEEFYGHPTNTEFHDARVDTVLNSGIDDDLDEHPLHHASSPISNQPSRRGVSRLSSRSGSSTGQSMGRNIDEDDEGNVERARTQSGQPKRSFADIDNGRGAEAEFSSKRMRAQLTVTYREKSRTTERASVGYGTPYEYRPRSNMAGPFNLDDSSSVTTSNMGH